MNIFEGARRITIAGAAILGIAVLMLTASAGADGEPPHSLLRKVRLVDQYGRLAEVPQEDASRLIDLGYRPADPKQKVTLADGGDEISLASLVEVKQRYGGPTPRLETVGRTFKRVSEETFGDAGGGAAALLFGLVRGATFGIAAYASPSMSRALLEQAQPQALRYGVVFGACGIGALLGFVMKRVRPSLATGVGAASAFGAALAALPTGAGATVVLSVSAAVGFVFGAATIIGWIVRGFMGIPRGMDKRPAGDDGASPS